MCLIALFTAKCAFCFDNFVCFLIGREHGSLCSGKAASSTSTGGSLNLVSAASTSSSSSDEKPKEEPTTTVVMDPNYTVPIVSMEGGLPPPTFVSSQPYAPYGQPVEYADYGTEPPPPGHQSADSQHDHYDPYANAPEY